MKHRIEPNAVVCLLMHQWNFFFKSSIQIYIEWECPMHSKIKFVTERIVINCFAFDF